jgi:hypothetical protein
MQKDSPSTNAYYALIMGHHCETISFMSGTITNAARANPPSMLKYEIRGPVQVLDMESPSYPKPLAWTCYGGGKVKVDWSGATGRE